MDGVPLNEIYERIGFKIYKEQWSSKYIETLERRNTPSGRSLNFSSLSNKEDLHKARLIKSKILRSLKNKNTKYKIVMDEKIGYVDPPLWFSFHDIYIPESYLITEYNEWYPCVVLDKNNDQLRRRKEFVGAGRPRIHNKEIIRGIIVGFLGDIEGKASYRKIRNKLKSICDERKMECPTISWLSDHCNDLVTNANRLRS